MTRRVVLCFVFILSLTGCVYDTPLDGLYGQERPVRIVLENNATVTQTFEVLVVELPAKLTVRRDDNKSSTTDIGQGLSNVDSGNYHNYTAVEPPNSAYLHGRYTLAPGEVNRSTIKADDLNRTSGERFPPQFAVVVVVYQDENVITSYVTANCDDLALVGLGVHSYPDPPGGIWAEYECA